MGVIITVNAVEEALLGFGVLFVAGFGVFYWIAEVLIRHRKSHARPSAR